MAQQEEVLEEKSYEGKPAPAFVYDHTETHPNQSYQGLPDPVAVYRQIVAEVTRLRSHSDEELRVLALAGLAAKTKLFQKTGYVE